MPISEIESLTVALSRSAEPELVGSERKPGKPTFLHPVSGWVLEVAAALDDARPGFLLGLSRLPPASRQAVFFALALRVDDAAGEYRDAVGRGTESDDLALLADELLRAKPAAVIKALVGGVPSGFVACLGKIGLDPLPDRGTYRGLFDLFADRRHRRRCLALLQKRSITSEDIQVIRRLDECLLHERVLARVPDLDVARQFSDAVSILKDFVSTATDETIAKAASDLGERTRLREWLGRWLQRADGFPPAPFETDPAVLVPLRSGSEMVEAGRDLRNCLATKINAVLSGRMYFYRLVQEGGGVGVLVKLTGGQWLLASTFAPGNRRLRGRNVEAIRAELQGAGCLVLAPVQDRFRRAAALFAAFNFDDFDDDLAEGLEQLLD